MSDKLYRIQANIASTNSGFKTGYAAAVANEVVPLKAELAKTQRLLREAVDATVGCGHPRCYGVRELKWARVLIWALIIFGWLTWLQFIWGQL